MSRKRWLLILPFWIVVVFVAEVVVGRWAGFALAVGVLILWRIGVVVYDARGSSR